MKFVDLNRIILSPFPTLWFLFHNKIPQGRIYGFTGVNMGDTYILQQGQKENMKNLEKRKIDRKKKK